MTRLPLLASLAGLLLLGACAEVKPPQAVSTTRRYAIDFQGAARNCTAPASVKLAEGQPAQAQITVANDGGWCALSTAAPGPHPYAVGLLTARPEHGKVYVHAVGDDTRVDYTPDRFYAGPDQFAVRLLPGQSTLQVAVTVAPGNGPQVASAPMH